MAPASSKSDPVAVSEVRGDTKNESTIKAQIESRKAAEATEDSPQPPNLGSGKLKAEQPINDFPEYAEVKRGYVKWTDNNGEFHKYPIDGTTAVREPAHEQHDLDVEDRDHLDQASAAKTPRRNNDEAWNAMQELHNRNLMNDHVHSDLALEGSPVAPEEPKEELKEGAPSESPTPTTTVPASESSDNLKESDQKTSKVFGR